MTPADPTLSTRPLPPGVIAVPEWGDELRADGTPAHRYLLHWSHADRTGPRNLVIGMNPSGASEKHADQTLLKVWGFCDVWNGGPFTMANVCPHRSTSPLDMQINPEIQRENIRRIVAFLPEIDGLIVIAHGDAPTRIRGVFSQWATILLHKIESAGRRVHCLGRTSRGSPRHPVMLGYATPLEPL